MSQTGKMIGRVCLGALTASLLPYQICKNKQTGGFRVRALLWSVEKTPGEERDKYTFELLPLAGGRKTEEEA